MGGRRTAVQVLANGLGGTVAAAAYMAVTPGTHDLCPSVAAAPLPTRLFCAFLAHYACCCGDTWASELGILASGTPHLVTTWRPVRPVRTDGAGEIYRRSCAGRLLCGRSALLAHPAGAAGDQRRRLGAGHRRECPGRAHHRPRCGGRGRAHAGLPQPGGLVGGARPRRGGGGLPGTCGAARCLVESRRGRGLSCVAADALFPAAPCGAGRLAVGRDRASVVLVRAQEGRGRPAGRHHPAHVRTRRGRGGTPPPSPNILTVERGSSRRGDGAHARGAARASTSWTTTPYGPVTCPFAELSQLTLV